MINAYINESLITKAKRRISNNDKPEHIAIVGLKGLGKTFLTENIFSKENCKEYYNNNKIISFKLNIDNSISEKSEFYHILHNEIVRGIRKLNDYDKNEYERLSSLINDYENNVRKNNEISERDEVYYRNLLLDTLEIIQKEGIKIIILIERFERFAISLNVKKTEYSFLRELAKGQIYIGGVSISNVSLFITSNKHIPLIAEEMNGSQFDGIFAVFYPKHLDFDSVNEIINMELSDYCFDENFRNYIYKLTGGIPELINNFINIYLDAMEDNIQISTEDIENNLYSNEESTFKKWWDSIHEKQKQICFCICENKKVDNQSIDYIRLKNESYIIDEDDKTSFITPLFNRFVREKFIDNENMNREISDPNILIIDELKKMNNNINSIKSLINDIPNKDRFIKGDYLNEEEYINSIRNLFEKRFNSVSVDDIKKNWHISEEIWCSFDNNIKNCCNNAYSLYEIYNNEMADADYSPITVFLGKMLESILSLNIIPLIKKYLPDKTIRVANGREIRIGYLDINRSIPIGNITYVLKNNNLYSKIVSYTENIEIDNIEFNNLISNIEYCRSIRNKTDHPGEKTGFDDMKNFVDKLFLNEKSIVKQLYILSKYAN